MRDEDRFLEIPTKPGEPPPRPGLLKRAETAKVTVPVVIGFIAILAVFCLAAAMMGHLVHHLRAR